jgi:uncharacterized iron-regulated protein
LDNIKWICQLERKSYSRYDKKELQKIELINQLVTNNIIVIGEKHYSQAVQTEEGKIIFDVVTSAKKENQFSTSWEFLNASAQQTTHFLFKQVLNLEISSVDFLLKTVGNSQSIMYSPIIDSTAILGGQLFGINLSREEKSPVVKNGLEALDPLLLPPSFKLGGANYLERFTEMMKDHATPEQISHYFAAQSLVDDVAACHLKNDSHFDLKFLIIGAFHSQFNDGVVERIKRRNPFSKISNIEIIDASDFTEIELNQLFSNQKYGDRADYLIFLNEPQ